MPTEKEIPALLGLFGDLKSPSRLAADRESLTTRYGRFSAQPFELGFGATVGNALRRALLSGLEGTAITAVKIEGSYQLSSILGVVEPGTHILLNLQKIPFKLNVNGPKTLQIFKEGAGQVTSADIETDDDVEVLDSTIHIAKVIEGGSLRIEMRLKRGRGHVSAAENSDEDLESGYIPIESVHAPVKQVEYTVEPTHVGEKPFEKLSLEIWTDGSVRPQDALALAANVISRQMRIFFNFEEDLDEPSLRKLEERHNRRLANELLKGLEELNTDICSLLARALEPTSGEDLIPAVRNVVQEESTARNYVTKRYRELIDRKYLTGLSQTENEELDALTLTLEEMDKPYYEAIVARLRNLIEQR